MNGSIIALIVAQLLFSFGDVLARFKMNKHGFTTTNLLSLWFLVYGVTHIAATMTQLYVFTNVELGRTITLFAVSGIVLANLTGLLLLGEVLSFWSYIGVAVALVAFLILAYSR